jgi:hypothetical protein
MLEEAINLYNQGIQLLISDNKIINSSNLSLKDEPAINEEVNIDVISNNQTNSSSNAGGYCVDSIEPKCNELKRLIDEFKYGYMSKLNLFRKNRSMLYKLQNVIFIIF